WPVLCCVFLPPGGCFGSVLLVQFCCPILLSWWPIMSICVPILLSAPHCNCPLPPSPVHRMRISMLADLLDQGSPLAAQCSHSGCNGAALWQILWRNPKIHSEDR